MSPWLLFSLANSLMMAFYLEANAVFKMNGAWMVILRSLFATLLCVPFFWDLDTLPSSRFFASAACIGLLAGAADSWLYDTAARYGGGMVSRLMSLKLWGGFLLWFAIMPSDWDALWATPFRAWGVIGCLLLAWVAVFFSRKCTVTSAAIKQMMPAIFLFTLCDVLHKYGMTGVATPQGNTLFTALVCIFMLPSAATLLLLKPVTPPTLRAFLHVGILSGFLYFLLMAVRNMAMSLTPNPAYVTAVVCLSSVWLYVWHWLKRTPDPANAWAGFGLVLSAVGLSFFVA